MWEQRTHYPGRIVHWTSTYTSTACVLEEDDWFPMGKDVLQLTPVIQEVDPKARGETGMMSKKQYLLRTGEGSEDTRKLRGGDFTPEWGESREGRSRKSVRWCGRLGLSSGGTGVNKRGGTRVEAEIIWHQFPGQTRLKQLRGLLIGCRCTRE